jgi:hypothetical protein
MTVYGNERARRRSIPGAKPSEPWSFGIAALVEVVAWNFATKDPEITISNYQA